MRWLACTRIPAANTNHNRRSEPCQRLSGSRLPGVDDPRRAELIDEHPESLRPERRLKRHLHFAFLRERTEDALSLGGVVEVNSHAKSSWLRELPGRRVGSLQHLI